jgi:hypothetical protein
LHWQRIGIGIGIGIAIGIGIGYLAIFRLLTSF